jgi:thiamine-monophosphate kinase
LSLVTTDMLLEGSCFRLAEAGPRRVGRKAMAVNLSDIAAMAGRPLAAVIAFAFARGTTDAVAQDLFIGAKAMADAFDTAIIGGDTNAWDGPLAISVTLIGETTARGPVCRHGARPGDRLYVTGPLGGSSRGKHLDFTPRVAEALELHERLDLRAMIDISDGFALDLHRLCAASGCGARVRAEWIPVADAAAAMHDERSPLEHALGDGEDFELLFAVAPQDDARIASELSFPVYPVGEVTDSEVTLLTAAGVEPLVPAGYRHNFGSTSQKAS